MGNCQSAFVEQKKAMQRGLGGSPHERLHQEAIALQSSGAIAI